MIQEKNRKYAMGCVRVVTATALLILTFLISGALAYADCSSMPEGRIEVYNGTVLCTFKNPPFVENGEIYLPLRETLDIYESAKIIWDNGQVLVTMQPLGDDATRSILVAYALEIGKRELIVTNQDDYKIVLAGYTLLKNGVTYVTTEFMELIFDAGHIPGYRVKYVLPRKPEAYVTLGEEVFIGTMAEQDEYSPVDANGNPILIKRIIVDYEGLVYSVATVENQQPEVITWANSLSGLHVGQFKDMYWGVGWANSVNHARLLRVNGIVVQRNGFSAYIPPACQITSSWMQEYENSLQT